MMAAALAGLSIDVKPGGREHPLPGPLAAGIRVLARKRPRELNPPCAVAYVDLVLFLHLLQVPSQLGRDDDRKRRGPVLVAFASTDRDLVSCEVDVLHAQLRALEEAKA
jgi:hypothetical protein